jgi:hypothetical protein
VGGNVNNIPKFLYTDSIGWILTTAKFMNQNNMGGSVVFASSWGNPLATSLEIANSINVDYCDGVALNTNQKSNVKWSFIAKFTNDCVL